jgi:hypothetical protein
MKVLLLFDKDFKVKKNEICELLNELTQYLEFDIGTDIEMLDGLITKPESFDFVSSQLSNPFDDYQRVFCFTDKPYDDNYFLHEHNLLSIISASGWSYLTDLPINNGIVYFVIYYFALVVDTSDFRHHEETGCIYDFLWSKDGIDDSMRQAKICPNCLERINNNLSSETQINLLEDLKKLMNYLANSSKWNQDVITDFQSQKTKIVAKRKSKKQGEINIVIASPGDTQVERKLLLDSLEIQFRRGNHESHCKKRLIVHGWEDLASQNGYPQDVINDKIIEEVDFVVALFKHKLGTPTYNQTTGKKRAESGTAEELLQAMDNTKTNHPLGMAYFYSKAPVISIDSTDLTTIKKNWDDLELFKKKIQNKMIYKPYTESSDLMKSIIGDLEKNIIDNFE